MHLLGLCLLAALSAAGVAGRMETGHAISIRIDDFALRDHQGRTWRLAEVRDRKAVVVIFLAAECPLAKRYAPRLVELASAYQRKGVAFVAIASNQHEELRELAHYARIHAIPFPVLKDTGNVIADRFAAERSPEAFVLDQERRIRYRGRIDDQYGVGMQKSRATRCDLADALDAVLAGQPVREPVTKAPGCPISRAERMSRPTAVTYCKEVAAILQKRCQVCHRPGQVAPFSLLSYRDASGWAGAIRKVVEERRMPPWGRRPGTARSPTTRASRTARKRSCFAGSTRAVQKATPPTCLRRRSSPMAGASPGRT